MPNSSAAWALDMVFLGSLRYGLPVYGCMPRPAFRTLSECFTPGMSINRTPPKPILVRGSSKGLLSMRANLQAAPPRNNQPAPRAMPKRGRATIAHPLSLARFTRPVLSLPTMQKPLRAHVRSGIMRVMESTCSNPLVSVIIPVYNTETYLRKCLDSVCGQTYGNLEIICVDDGSMDDSAAILREYEKRDSRIIVILQENGGVSTARNNALKMTRGEWVTFVDSDDYLDPDYFQAFAHALKATPDADVMQSAITLESVDGIVLGERGNTRGGLSSGLHEGTYEKLLFGVWGEGWAKMFRTSIIREHGLQFNKNLEVSEDQEFTCRYLMWCRNICLVDHAGYHYIQHSSSCIQRFLTGDMPFAVYKRTSLYYVKLMSQLPPLLSKAQKKACCKGLARLCVKSFVWRTESLAKHHSHTWSRATWLLVLCIPYMIWRAGLRMGCSRQELSQFATQLRAALRAGV